MSLKAKVEAVLFLTAKPIRAQALARIVNADVQAVRQAVLELVHDYEERKGGLEISDEDGYSFQVKEEFAQLMDEFLPVELSAALIRTLSAIAIKQPISQSEIIRVRGAGAYDHIRELVNRDLIAKREENGGRSPILSTTKKFQEYFRLTKEGKDLRTYLKRQVRKAVAADAAADAAAMERQLVIQQVVGSPEADSQLNQGIFLETADGGSDNFDSTDSAVNDLMVADGSSGDLGLPPLETSEFGSAASIENASPPAGEVAVSAPDISVPDAVIPDFSEALAVTESTERVDMPAKTLSKLAKAAKSKEPKPVPVETTDNSPDPVGVDISLAELSTPDAAVNSGVPDFVATPSEPVPPETAEAGAPPTGAKAQARNVRKNEPAIGTNKGSRPRLDKQLRQTERLQDLLFKQKQFERQLKLGLFQSDDAEAILEIDPSVPPIEKTV